MHTLDKNSKAAVPGALIPARRRYTRYYATESLAPWKLYLGTRVPHWLSSKTGFLHKLTHHWLQTQEHLQYGCLCPSVVIDGDSLLVATFTSLNAQGEGSVPVIKIHPAPLDLLEPEFRRTGTRLASVSIFHRTNESRQKGQWSDFTPIVAACLVDDTAAWASAQSRISELAWKALDIGISQLKSVRSPGLYHVTVPHEIVWNAF